MSEINKLYGYWGKFHHFDDGVTIEPRMIWIGAMSREEMKEHFPEFRHNFKAMNQHNEITDNSKFLTVNSDHIPLPELENLQDDDINYEPSGGVTSCWACNGTGCSRCVDWVEE